MPHNNTFFILISLDTFDEEVDITAKNDNSIKHELVVSNIDHCDKFCGSVW